MVLYKMTHSETIHCICQLGVVAKYNLAFVFQYTLLNYNGLNQILQYV